MLIVFISYLALGLLIFSPCLQGGFISIDDNVYITQNVNVLSGLSIESINAVFTKSFYGNWAPLALLSSMLDLELFGLNAYYHHLVSLLLHIFNSFLFFLCLRKVLSGKNGGRASGGEIAFFSGLLFLVHPFHVDTVAWASSRKDVLSAFFFFLSINQYLNFRNKSSGVVSSYYLSVAFFFLALLSKSVVFYLPLILLLLDYYSFDSFSKQSFNKQVILEKLPYCVLSIVFLIISFYSLSTLIQPLEIGFIGFVDRVKNSSFYLLKYIYLFFEPSNLSFYYANTFKSVDNHKTVIFILLFAASLFYAFLNRKKHSDILFSMIWFLIGIFPCLQLVQLGNMTMANRWVYLPSVGLIVFLVTLISKLHIIRLPLLLICSIYFALFTYNRSVLWSDELKLLKNALAVQPDNYIVLNTLGSYLHSKPKENLNSESLSYFLKSLKINPYQPRVIKYLKSINKLDSNYELEPRSIAQKLAYAEILNINSKYEKSLNLYKELESKFNNYERYYTGRSEVFTSLGMYEESIRDLERAIEINPISQIAFNKLGIVYEFLKEDDKALSSFKKAYKINKNSTVVGLNYSIKLIKDKNFILAKKILSRVEKLYSLLTREEAQKLYLAFGNLYLEKKEIEKAKFYYLKVIELAPKNIDALNEIGKIYFFNKKFSKSIETFKKVLVLKPNDKSALNNLKHLRQLGIY